jgi:hypothetical protein
MLRAHMRDRGDNVREYCQRSGYEVEGAQRRSRRFRSNAYRQGRLPGEARADAGRRPLLKSEERADASINVSRRQTPVERLVVVRRYLIRRVFEGEP